MDNFLSPDAIKMFNLIMASIISLILITWYVSSDWKGWVLSMLMLLLVKQYYHKYIIFIFVREDENADAVAVVATVVAVVNWCRDHSMEKNFVRWFNEDVGLGYGWHNKLNLYNLVC